jgi:hypothetical protein
VTFTTTTPPSTSCQVNNMSTSKSTGQWKFKWDINSNCNSYTVTVSRYGYADPLIPPPSNATPIATGIRLTNYVPTSGEISAGFIDQVMNPQPSTLNFWYSFDVTCNATTCSGTKVTRSPYFYHQ